MEGSLCSRVWMLLASILMVSIWIMAEEGEGDVVAHPVGVAEEEAHR